MHNTEHRPLVYICSPFAGDIQQNTENARIYCRFAIEHGAIPFAPHLLYPQFMDDDKPEERALALEMGLRMLDRCDELWVFGRKISAGMYLEITYAMRIGKPVRNLIIRTVIDRVIMSVAPPYWMPLPEPPKGGAT